MSTGEPSVERLDLRFLADSNARPRSNYGLWITFTIMAVAAGIGGWVLSRQLLKHELAEQLANSPNSAESLLALESLLQLDETAELGVARGFENADPRVVLAAYLALDNQITSWRAQDSTKSAKHMQDLTDRLAKLPAFNSVESRIMVCSLAARMYSYCLEKNDAGLDPLMKRCEYVVSSVGASLADSSSLTAPSQILPADTDTEDPRTPQAALNAFSAMDQPPPPLPQATLADGQALTPSATIGTVSQLTSGRVSFTDSESIESTVPVFSLSDSEVGEPKAGASTMSFSDDLGPDSPVADLSSAHEPPNDTPTVARTIGDDGPLSLSVGGPIAISGLRDKSDLQVVRLLSSVQDRVSQAAAYELRARGWPDGDVDLALELACSSETKRLQLVRDIAAGRDDPRDWLLWMAEDGQPAVRKAAVSLLHSMLDAKVELSLRRLLNREADESVSQTIRQVLVAREGLANPLR